MSSRSKRKNRAVYLKYVEGLQQKEIAERIGVRPETVSEYLNEEEAEEVEQQIKKRRVQIYRMAEEILQEQMLEVSTEKEMSELGSKERYFRRSEIRQILDELDEIYNIRDLVNELADARDERIEVTGELDDETRDILNDLKEDFEA